MIENENIEKGEKRTMSKLFSERTNKVKAKVNGMVARNRMILTLAVVSVLTLSSMCFGADADTLWTTISELIGTWVTRLGAVVMFVGGVMFGLGWKSDDAEQKSRGISTIIAGAIVTAVAGLTATFFA